MIDLWTVYIHENKINGKKYVGITSGSVNRRWKNGYGYSRKLPIGKAIEKYGWDNFNHKIVAEGLDEVSAKEMERNLIESLKTQNREFGYNLTDGGDGINGYKHSDSTRKKLSEAAQRQNRYGERNPNYGHKWSDEKRNQLSEARKKENLSQETLKKMSDAASKRMKEANPFKGKHHTEEVKRIISERQSRPVLMFDLDGNFIREYSSIINAAKDNGICKVAISNCCRGITKTSGGYIWKYKDSKI